MTGELRSHASPVLSLKESIDEYFREHGSKSTTRAALLAIHADTQSENNGHGLYDLADKPATSCDKQVRTMWYLSHSVGGFYIAFLAVCGCPVLLFITLHGLNCFPHNFAFSHHNNNK